MSSFFHVAELMAPLRAGMFWVSYRAEEELYLPPYQGSTLRGALGSALRQMMCVTIPPDCDSCLVSDRCIYRNIFATVRDKQAVARPYVIKPPLTQRTIYYPGEVMEFGLVLIGQALDYLPYLVIALQKMGHNGIGRGRGRMALQEVRAQHPYRQQGMTIYAAGQNIIEAVDDLIITTPDLVFDGPATNMVLEFITPTRLKREGRLRDDFTFELLVRALLRRVYDLSSVQGSPVGAHDELLLQAADIAISESSLEWFDWERYSRRQKSRMKLGGLVGRVVLQGDLAPFMPLVRWGEVVHVGKNTAFGLGQYRVKNRQSAG